MAGIQLFVVVGVSKIGDEKPRVRPDCRINSPNWTFKKLARGFESGDEGIHPENDLVSKSRAWVFREGANKNIQK
jgi:hypothetical protein